MTMSTTTCASVAVNVTSARKAARVSSLRHRSVAVERARRVATASSSSSSNNSSSSSRDDPSSKELARGASDGAKLSLSRRNAVASTLGLFSGARAPKTRALLVLSTLHPFHPQKTYLEGLGLGCSLRVSSPQCV